METAIGSIHTLRWCRGTWPINSSFMLLEGNFDSEEAGANPFGIANVLP